MRSTTYIFDKTVLSRLFSPVFPRFLVSCRLIGLCPLSNVLTRDRYRSRFNQRVKVYYVAVYQRSSSEFGSRNNVSIGSCDEVEVARRRPLASDASEWRLNGLQNDGQLHSPLSVAVEGGEVECRRAHSWHGYEATHLPLFYSAQPPANPTSSPERTSHHDRQGAAATDGVALSSSSLTNHPSWLLPAYFSIASTPFSRLPRIVRLYERGRDHGSPVCAALCLRVFSFSFDDKQFHAILFSDSSGTV